jgi:hypothetical protein
MKFKFNCIIETTNMTTELIKNAIFNVKPIFSRLVYNSKLCEIGFHNYVTIPNYLNNPLFDSAKHKIAKFEMAIFHHGMGGKNIILENIILV